MIAPVSVCHQLSWIGRPSVSSPQSTASGFSGSPTLAMKRSARQVVVARSPAPGRRISIRTAVGAVYQTVTRSRRGSRTSASVELGLVHDDRDAVRERRDDPVRGARHPAGVGGAPEDVVGVQVERQRAASRGGRTTASWTCIAPFGVPVVPLVKCSSAGSSGSVGPIS